MGHSLWARVQCVRRPLQNPVRFAGSSDPCRARPRRPGRAVVANHRRERQAVAMATRPADDCPRGNARGLARWVVILGLVVAYVAYVGATATTASAHGDEKNKPSADLVRIAIAILEVHPSPSAAVDDKIHDAEVAGDKSGVQIALVQQAKAALDRGDVAATKRFLEQAIGECPDSDVLYVSDQSPKPPCIAPAHALAVARKAVGGTSEIVILIIAAGLALAGIAVISHPFVRRREGSAA